MDAISFSAGLEWLFAFVFALPILLLIVSVMIWAYKNFKHLVFIAYIVDIVFTLFVLWTDISNVAIYFSCGNSLYNLCIINCVFLLISIICMFISIVYYRKNKVLGNISINIATGVRI